MARVARSARGEMVDFDILAIKQSLASAPISISTEERRTFIDTKNGLKPKQVVNNGLKVLAPEEVSKPVLPDALADVMLSIVEANRTVEEPSTTEVAVSE